MGKFQLGEKNFLFLSFNLLYMSITYAISNLKRHDKPTILRKDR